MKSKKEIKEWLLKNCLNEDGNLDLSHLDFSDFDGTINISYMKVKNNLFQCYYEVGGNLYQLEHIVEGDLIQGHHKVGGNLEQDFQKVDGDLKQHFQKVGGDFITQTLEDDEEYDIEDDRTYIVKHTTKLTKEEIEELLGYKIKIVKEKQK